MDDIRALWCAVQSTYAKKNNFLMIHQEYFYHEINYGF